MKRQHLCLQLRAGLRKASGRIRVGLGELQGGLR